MAWFAPWGYLAGADEHLSQPIHLGTLVRTLAAQIKSVRGPGGREER